jgi:hypothetical protein
MADRFFLFLPPSPSDDRSLDALHESRQRKVEHHRLALKNAHDHLTANPNSVEARKAYEEALRKHGRQKQKLVEAEREKEEHEKEHRMAIERHRGKEEKEKEAKGAFFSLVCLRFFFFAHFHHLQSTITMLSPILLVTTVRPLPFLLSLSPLIADSLPPQTTLTAFKPPMPPSPLVTLMSKSLRRRTDTLKPNTASDRLTSERLSTRPTLDTPTKLSSSPRRSTRRRSSISSIFITARTFAVRLLSSLFLRCSHFCQH